MRQRGMPADDETWARYKALCALEGVGLHMLFAVWVERAWDEAHPPKESQPEADGE